MTEYTVRREKRLTRRILLSLTDELYAQVKDYARERGVSMAAAIRFLITEALIREKYERERGKGTTRE
jgi:macrodomain Ter protein organizer (MatP/YcbG family)